MKFLVELVWKGGENDQAPAIYLTADGSVILQGTAVDVDQRKELHLPLDGGLIHVDHNLVRAIKEML
jgi:hypothetical protein